MLRRASVPPRAKDSGLKRGTAFRVGASRWSAGARPLGFCRKAQERKEESERIFRSPGRSKALKSEAHERWGLKEAPEGWEAKPSHREGSQTLG